MTSNDYKDYRDYTLTPRQLETMQWAAMGKSAPSIALFMDVTKDSVYFHQKKVIDKLECGGLIHAVALLTKKGLVDPEKTENPYQKEK